MCAEVRGGGGVGGRGEGGSESVDFACLCSFLSLLETFFLVVLVGLGVQIEILLIRTGVDVGKGG